MDFSAGSVEVIAGSDPVERNAVEMILNEVQSRYQRKWTASQASVSRGTRIVLGVDQSRGLGTDGYHIVAKGNEVRISANTPRGLLFGAADLLDLLQDAPLRIPEQARTEVAQSKYRGAGLSVPCSQEKAQQIATFEQRVRYVARLRFNYITITGCETNDAIRLRYFPELERKGVEAKAQAAVEGIRGEIRYARNWGLDVYLNMSEINYPVELVQKHPSLRATPPPDADRTYRPPTAGGASTLYERYGVKPNLCVSESKSWEFVEGKVREIAELFPEIAGIKLSINGADSDVFFCHCERCRRLAKPERAELVFRHVTRALDLGAPGKKLIFDPYMGAWKNLLEPEVYGPLAGRLPASVIMRFNAQYGDFYLFNSLNPMIGKFAPNDEIYEFDPGGEYHGGFFGLQPTISRYMAERVKAYAARGVKNISFRNLQYHTDFSELDWNVGASLAWDPDQDVEKLRSTWARRQFGAEAGPWVLELMDLGFEVMRKALYADGINFTNWGLFIENVNRTRHILVDRSAKMADRGMERIAPTSKNIARLIGEKEEALQLAEQGLLRVEQARGKVSSRHQKLARTSFRRRSRARGTPPVVPSLSNWFSHPFYYSRNPSRGGMLSAECRQQRQCLMVQEEEQVMAAHLEGKMKASERIQFAPIQGAAELFTPDFVDYLAFLHDRFNQRIHIVRETRGRVLQKALHQGVQPAHLAPSKINTEDWRVPSVPEDLQRRGIEISGPASVTGMFINALNPGPEGMRAEGDLDDDEDSGGHRFEDTVAAAWNRKRAVERTLTYYDPEKGKEYKLQEGELPFFMHRERGLHLDEPDVTVDEVPISAAILGTALTLFHAGRSQAERGQGIYFYLPKMESAEEARFWRDFFDASLERLDFLKSAVIRAIALIESLPAAYQMEEILHALGPYAAGLNAARWDFQASILEFVMNDPKSVWPDRFGVDIKKTDFLANIFRRLVAICLKRGAVPIGGMAVALPSKEDEVNRAAAAAIRADKEWEAQQGFLRAWVAHIFHMKTAADPFKDLHASGWKPSSEMANPDHYPIEIKIPEGPITLEGTRRNARMLLEYLEGWLGGRGAKGIDSLAGKPGIHPALMEDLATARISVAQIAQRILHQARTTDTGEVHDRRLVRRLLQEEAAGILARLQATLPADEKSRAAYSQSEVRYRKSVKIALRWIQNHTELNFRSLGSYTRAQLDEIAALNDAF